MAEKEIETDVIKFGDDLAIPLPITFCDGTIIKEGATLKIVPTKVGNFEIRVSQSGKEMIKCQLCDKNVGKYTCTQCGALSCSACFWEMGGMCNKCVAFKK